jgi:CheY-like chemotaxis protein
MHQQTIFFLIDDDSDDIELFNDALTDANQNFFLYSAEDGISALKKLRNEQFPRPSYIFLDINMPGMGGWEFLSSIKHDDKLKSIPIIMYSTSSHPHDIDKALRGGAIAFFRKPDSIRELTDVLTKVATAPVSALPDSLGKKPGFWLANAD